MKVVQVRFVVGLPAINFFASYAFLCVTWFCKIGLCDLGQAELTTFYQELWNHRLLEVYVVSILQHSLKFVT